ncbi:hypothetical protein [Corynebacterium sp. CCUG 69979]|uniref:hypothetical protein n=1 Tax=Corynebacterium sp. CCUG 69979 TaxID=2823890 RepID=UPI00210B0A63|nr:hypothetical protein [Corynebacterium sp. CCUG 69979]
MPPDAVMSEVWSWLNLMMYITLGLSVIAVIAFGTLLALDKDRGEVRTTSPYVRGLEIALGVMVISGAKPLATWMIS